MLTARAHGRSLQSRLQRGDRWTDVKLRRILQCGLEVLSYLHELNPPLFHCDVQPQHIVVSDRGALTLTGFGAARSLLTPGPRPAGRAGYCAGDGASGVAADLVGLGATIAAVASGVDASELPRRAHQVDVRACMRDSPVRDAVSLLVSARNEVHCTAAQVLALLRQSRPA